MGSPPPEYSSVAHPSAPSIDNSPPPRPPPINVQPSMANPNPSSMVPPAPPPPPVYTQPMMANPVPSSMVPPPVYAQPMMVPYAVPVHHTAPPPVTNIVIQNGGSGPNGGMGAGDGKLSPLLCPRCKQGILIKQRNKCIKVTIIVLIIITFPFGLLLIPFLCCIWQNKCPVCLRISGSPVGMKNSR